jgi:hypothetical protein
MLTPHDFRHCFSPAAACFDAAALSHYFAAFADYYAAADSFLWLMITRFATAIF